MAREAAATAVGERSAPRAARSRADSNREIRRRRRRHCRPRLELAALVVAEGARRAADLMAGERSALGAEANDAEDDEEEEEREQGDRRGGGSDAPRRVPLALVATGRRLKQLVEGGNLADVLQVRQRQSIIIDGVVDILLVGHRRG